MSTSGASMNSVVDKSILQECDTPRELTSLEHYMKPLRQWLDDRDLTDLAINREFEVWTEYRSRGWVRHPAAFVTSEWCMHFASLVANYTVQRISADAPILSGTLPTNERIQIVIPPAVMTGEISIVIRRPSSELWTLDDLENMGVFGQVKTLPRRPADPSVDDYDNEELELLGLLRANQVKEFLSRAVETRQNILMSGATGSGKTTVGRALTLRVPSVERCISIEDASEMSFPNQPNHTRLFYSQGGQGVASLTVEDLLTSTKRMYPSRVFVSEIRTGNEVYYYLTSVASGHKGSITSAHSGSAENAFWTLAQLMQNSGPGTSMSLEGGVRLVQANIDVVIHCRAIERQRVISEIWYDPSTKRRSIA
ncbi:MAG: P-type DNA transfer ATPase VirB11 [Denitromonas halophila]|nr:MAG: P-type DNA transfer ATPase VirB11 [Denitromonas halophila]